MRSKSGEQSPLRLGACPDLFLYCCSWVVGINLDMSSPLSISSLLTIGSVEEIALQRKPLDTFCRRAVLL